MARISKRTDNFYRRDPSAALRGMMDLSLDEIAVYNILIDLMYQSWRPLPYHSAGQRSWVVGWVPGAPQKINPIIRRLIDKGRIVTVEIGGELHLTDDRFEAERAVVKGIPKPAANSDKVAQKSGEVGEKSEEVSAKSERTTPVLTPQNEENQSHAGTEKKRVREDKEEEKKEKQAKEKRTGRGRREPVVDPPPRKVWAGDPAVRERVVAAKGEGWAVSYLDQAEAVDGGIRAANDTGFLALRACHALQGIRVFEPDG